MRTCNHPCDVCLKPGTALRVPGATLAEVERATIIATYLACGRSAHKTAAILNVSVRKIQYRIQDYRKQGVLPEAEPKGVPAEVDR